MTYDAIDKKLPAKPQKGDIAAFLGKAKAVRAVASRQRRLVFALDATASREPSWARARAMHRELFQAANVDANIAIQLCYYRGLSEFEASPWLSRSDELLAHMDAVTCLGGATQIARLLRHYLQAGSSVSPLRALVFVGDAVEEPSQSLYQLAGQCGMKQQPLFLFQEGDDPHAAGTLEHMARLSGGAYARLDANSSELLRELLGAVVRYATGGPTALLGNDRQGDKILLEQLSGNAKG